MNVNLCKNKKTGGYPSAGEYYDKALEESHGTKVAADKVKDKHSFLQD